MATERRKSCIMHLSPLRPQGTALFAEPGPGLTPTPRPSHDRAGPAVHVDRRARGEPGMVAAQESTPSREFLRLAHPATERPPGFRHVGPNGRCCPRPCTASDLIGHDNPDQHAVTRIPCGAPSADITFISAMPAARTPPSAPVSPRCLRPVSHVDDAPHFRDFIPGQHRRARRIARTAQIQIFCQYRR